MHFYSPWVDPRVKQVRSRHLSAYLRKQGWRDEGLARQYLRCFRQAAKNAAVYLPTLEEADDYAVCIFEAVTELARIEDRYAGDVLTDLLAQPAGDAETKPTLPPTPKQGDALVQAVNR
jgi:hypothetical protein